MISVSFLLRRDDRTRVFDNEIRTLDKLGDKNGKNSKNIRTKSDIFKRAKLRGLIELYFVNTNLWISEIQQYREFE